MLQYKGKATRKLILTLPSLPISTSKENRRQEERGRERESLSRRSKKKKRVHGKITDPHVLHVCV